MAASRKKSTTKKKASKGRKKAAAKKKAATSKAPRKKLGEVALVLRVPKEAVAYLDEQAGDGARTKVVREILSKGDAKLARILATE